MALIELFNKSPGDGVEELLRCEGVDSNQLPQAGAPQVLRFLREAATGLDVERVGDWLCGDGPLNAQVLQALLTDVCVAGLSLDRALQLSVADILLPGNLGRAERLLFAFAWHYHLSNPHVFDSIDTVEALCLAATLLSANLHGTAAASEEGGHVWRVSRDQFVQHCQSQNEVVPRSVAEKLYDMIVAHPPIINIDGMCTSDTRTCTLFSVPTQHEGWLRFQEVSRTRVQLPYGHPSTDAPCLLAGRIKKEGAGRHTNEDGVRGYADGDGEEGTWRRRYVVVNDLGIFIFRGAPLIRLDCELVCTLPLEHLVVSQPSPSNIVVHKEGGHAGGFGFQVQGQLCVNSTASSSPSSPPHTQSSSTAKYSSPPSFPSSGCRPSSSSFASAAAAAIASSSTSSDTALDDLQLGAAMFAHAHSVRLLVKTGSQDDTLSWVQV